MKTLAALLILTAIFLIISQTSFKKDPVAETSPSFLKAPTSSRSLSIIPTHEKKLSREALKAAIETEWSKLNDRKHNRELSTIITFLRELGRRDGLKGIEFLSTLPRLNNEYDFAQAKIAVIAGWGIDHHVDAGTFLYWDLENFTPLVREHSPEFTKQSGAVKTALDLVEYEIQNRWLNEDRETFLRMIYRLPIDHKRLKSVKANFRALYSAPTKNLSLSSKESNNKIIKPRFPNQAYPELDGERSKSLVEWAARNPELARNLISPQKGSSAPPIHNGDLHKLIHGLAYQSSDYQSLFGSLSKLRREMVTPMLASLISESTHGYTWPVDGRPNPWKLSPDECAQAMKSYLKTETILGEKGRAFYLNLLNSRFPTK